MSIFGALNFKKLKFGKNISKIYIKTRQLKKHCGENIMKTRNFTWAKNDGKKKETK
jgi:hypothetical protein